MHIHRPFLLYIYIYIFIYLDSRMKIRMNRSSPTAGTLVVNKADVGRVGSFAAATVEGLVKALK